MSSWIAVTNSRVPATLKSMSPSASSAPRMSVSVTNLPSSAIMPIAMPATGALIGTPASISDSVEPQTRRHRRRAVRAQHVRHQPQRVRELLLVRDHRHERPLGERAVADLATARRADAARLARGVAAGSCSGACSACVSSRSSVSIICVMRSMPSVVTFSTCVSPRLEERRAVRPREHARPRPTAAGCPWWPAAVEADALARSRACA